MTASHHVASLYVELATRAMDAGWSPTDGIDAQGRPLWSMPGRDGLVPLDVFRETPGVREAA